MAVFVELVTDMLHSYYAENITGQTAGKGRAGSTRARRPTRGLEIKDDTYAMLKVIGADGIEIPLLDSGACEGASDGYTNFILQNVQESRSEKQQILETFGEAYVFFFGENPKMLTCQALLLNSNDFNWEAEWWENYDKYLRGTKLVEQGARCYMFYDDTVVEGYMVMAKATKTADNPLAVGLQFQFFVTAYSNISLTESKMFPVRDSVLLPDGIELTSGNSREQLVTHLRDETLSSKALLPQQHGESLGDYIERRSQVPDNLVTSTYSSGAFAADVDKYLFQLSPKQRQALVHNYIYVRGMPLRGEISENYDEYVGAEVNAYPEYASITATPANATIRTSLEVEDLFRKSIEVLACFGADVNNPKAMEGLGLGVSFGASAGVSLGGAGAYASATYGPQPNSRFGYGFKGSARAKAKVGVGSTADLLGSVFGPSSSIRDPRYNQGAGDPGYGYASAYAGAGFGHAGFGGFGGAGFGSGLGHFGDPGHKSLDRFTFAGSADNKGAMERFETAQGRSCQNEYYATAGIDAQGNEYSGSGERKVCRTDTSSRVGGAVSAFAMVSVKGVLDPTGNARSDPSAISAEQQAHKFGKAKANPFGVKCLDMEGGNVVKESWKWP